MQAKNLLVGVALASIMAMAGAAQAGPMNQPPPAGAILDLNGLPITNSEQVYSVSFVGGVTSTAITFAFRQDPSFESFSNVSVVDLTTSSGNLLTNGDFSGGTYTNNGNGNTPVGWTYANVYGATFGGGVASGATCGSVFAFCWFDGAVQAYDAISQTISTNVGDIYQISFALDGGGGTTYSRLSTNGNVIDTGGNGIDVLTYAQAGLPAPGVPEPATWALMLVGFGGLGIAMRRQAKRMAALSA